MSILDRAIARQYLSNIAALLFIVSVLIVSIDLSLNLDRFTSAARGVHQAQPGLDMVWSVARVVADLWWPRLVQLYTFLVGIVLVGAMGFTISQMSRHRELVAILASGQSLWTVARPILVVAGAFLGLQVACQELVLPRIAPLLTRDQGDAGRRALGISRVALASDAQGRLWYALEFDADANTLRGVHVIERDESGVAVQAYTAPSARWDSGAWVLPVGTRIEDRARGTSRNTSDDLKPAELVLRTDLDPTALLIQRFEGLSQNLSWGQLGTMLAQKQRLRPDLRDRLVRIRLGRVASIAGAVLSILIVMPSYLSRVPRNMAVQSLKCAPVAIVALIASALGSHLAIPGIPPHVSVFLPTMLMLPAAIVRVSNVQT